MKLSARFLTLLALAAAALTGCRQEEADFALPSIKISGPNFIFNEETKKAACAVDMNLTTLHLALEANRDWSAVIDWDAEEVPWIAVTPDVGKASDSPQRVTVTILNNAGFNRNKQVKFTIGYDYKTVYFNQAGERGEEIIGTLENPLSVAGAIKYVKSLGSDVQSSTGVYIKGKISRIDDNNNFASSGTFGNASFYISDDGSTSTDMFYCYRVLYLGNKKWSSKTDTDIKVGDEVTIYGYVVNYKGSTPETVQGTAFIYEHNGVNRGTDESGGSSSFEPGGSGTVDDPYNVAAAIAAVKPLTWTSNDNYETTDEVYVKGKISRIADNGTFGQSGNFGNATFYISDDGTGNGELYAYRILYLGNEKYTAGEDIKLGDEVIICGKLMNYRGNTPETVANSAYLFSLNGAMGGGTSVDFGPAMGSGTVNDPFNVSMAYQKASALSSDDKLENVYVKGKITRVTSIDISTYGNAEYYIADEGFENSDFLVYRGYYLGGEKFTAVDQIKEGDEVIVYGTLVNFRGTTKEITQGSSIYSLNGKTAGGDTPQPPGPTGDVQVVTVSAFIAAAESDTQVYELTGTIGGSVNQTYGNFDLTDDTGTVYVYGMTATNLGYGATNDQSYASLGLQAGDKIKLRGYRGSFNGKVELVYGWFIEKVGEGSIITPTGSGTLEDPYTPFGAIAAVANLTWTSNTDYQKTDKVYVKGTISRIASAGTYTESGTYGNASYWISADGTQTDELQIYRSLYFNGEKYTSGTDIKVGDEVIVYGSLMNYKGNTPETVANENWLYSLNGKTDGSGGGTTPSGNGSGTLSDPYTPAGAIAAVANLTWTSNTDYQKTDKVYVKGKISRIANNGTYVGGGTYGNASYWISADGTENEEFQIYRSLYFNGEKYTEGTDIQVGDEVVVYGALMNYKGNTPETVANENWLYSLNGKTDGSGSGGDSGSGSGGGDTGSTLSFGTTSADGTWAQDTDATYGAGFSATIQGVTVGYYKHTGSSNLNAPSTSEARIYKNSALSVTAPAGKTFKKIVVKCPGTGSGQYCLDMAGLEGGGSGVADKAALTVTWTGSASKVVLHANSGQVRMTGLEIEFE